MKRYARWSEGLPPVSPNLAVFVGAVVIALPLWWFGAVRLSTAIFATLLIFQGGVWLLGRYGSRRLLRRFDADEDEIAVVMKITAPGRLPARDEGAVCLVDGFLHYRGRCTAWSVRAVDVTMANKSFVDEDRTVRLFPIDSDRQRNLSKMVWEWRSSEAEGESIYPPNEEQFGSFLVFLAPVVATLVLVTLLTDRHGWPLLWRIAVVVVFCLLVGRWWRHRFRHSEIARFTSISRPEVGENGMDVGAEPVVTTSGS